MRVFLIILLLVFSKAMAQNKDSIYRLESLPMYDQDGNMTTYTEEFNYVPTSEDSAAFIKRGHGIITKEYQEQSQKDFDAFMKEYYQENPPDSTKVRKSSSNKPKKKS